MADRQPQREMMGILFKNENRPQNNDRIPEYTGECTINGKVLRMAAWLKQGRSGKQFMSFQFSEPQQQQQSGGGSKSRDDEDSRNFF